jgi:hypothetical protein
MNLSNTTLEHTIKYHHCSPESCCVVPTYIHDKYSSWMFHCTAQWHCHLHPVLQQHQTWQPLSGMTESSAEWRARYPWEWLLVGPDNTISASLYSNSNLIIHLYNKQVVVAWLVAVKGYWASGIIFMTCVLLQPWYKIILHSSLSKVIFLKKNLTYFNFHIMLCYTFH